jgi:hypothetical protein
MNEFDEPFFRTDPLFKNWFAVEVRDDLFTQQALSPELEEWLADNVRLPWDAQFSNGMVSDGDRHGDVSYVTKPFCRVMFRAKRDATLFKLFWSL